MEQVLTLGFLVSALAAAIAAGSAILFACLGELLAERAGVLNLGVEGMMLMGAVAGVAITLGSGSPWLGAGAAVLAGAAMASIHALLAVGLKANQVVSGLALTLFGSGFSAFLGQPYVGLPLPASFGRVAVPLLADLPLLGPILFRQDPLVYLSYALVPGLWFFVYRTPPGLRLRACYVIVGGALAGLGGAAISLGTNPGWTEGMTAGRGWIAVALVIFAGWNPARAALGAYLFGGVEAGQFRLQGVGVDVSPFFLSMLPYLFTILVLVLATRPGARHRLGAPAALGLPYQREERG